MLMKNKVYFCFEDGECNYGDDIDDSEDDDSVEYDDE